LDIGAIWDVIALQPMINIVIGLSDILFGSFGLAIIALTIVIRGLMYPLTRKQLNATKAMQGLQPKLAELQKKHGKDKQKLAQEQMKLYKESGVSPTGCLVPMLIQMPIWIALYQSIIRVLAVNPDSFLNLSRYLYDWPIVYSALPLNQHFLWMNLASSDFFLALLVGASMWVTQKMTTPVSADPKQQAQGRTMLIMMPLMFTFLSLSFPSGLALYWVASNLITIGMQYFIVGGWGGLLPARAKKLAERDKKLKSRIAEVEQASPGGAALQADIVATDSTQIEGVEDERGEDKRQDSGGGYRTSLRKIRRRPRGSRGRRSKRR
jgi:YidC/Oxa1 family membrane protein insertase